MASWEDALREIVRTRGSALLRYAFLLCGDSEEAADLVQDALLRTFSRATSGTNVDAIEPYLKRAILNRHVDQVRRRNRFESVKHLLVSPATTGPFETAIGARHGLRAALASLPARQRAAVVLRFYDDLPVAGIAQAMGCSPGAVKRYLSDGTRTLEAQLRVSDERSPT